jgi:hypothetical protein
MTVVDNREVPDMNLAHQFEVLGGKQLAIQEGINLLRQAQLELGRARVAADAWGMMAVMANLTIIPLNCIVNAFDLKAANTVYKIVVRQLYSKFGKSGTRWTGTQRQRCRSSNRPSRRN